MNLTQVWKSGLAVMFACTMSFALVGCDNGGTAPAPTDNTGAEEGAEGGSAAGAGEEVPE